MNQHNITIDYFKSILIILVVIGHIIPFTLSESLVRTIIYSFHMPLFLGISGLLIKAENLITKTPQQFLNKYLHRLFIPWVIAFITFYIYVNHKLILSGQFNFWSYVFSIIYPYYHLWYGLSFFLILLFTFFTQKLNINYFLLFIISITIAILVNYTSETIRTPHIKNGLILNLLGDKRTYLYFPFFIWGVLLQRSNKLIDYLKIKYTQWIIFILICTITIILTYYYKHQSTLPFFTSFIYNIAIITKVKWLSDSEVLRNLKRNSLINWLSINSLFIYLYHPIIIISTKNAIQKHVDSIPIYVILMTLLTLSTLTTIEYALKKQMKLHRIICGN